MRLWVQNRNLVDQRILALAGHQIVDRQEEAQVLIACAYVPHQANPKNVIMLYFEPPLGPGYSTIYQRAATFRAFGSMVDLGLPNSFPLTLDPIVYPYGVDILRDRRRENTTLWRRRVFYAGTRVGHPKGGDGDYGRVALYNTRNRLVEDLRSNKVDVYAEGNGWETSTRSRPDWDQIKGKRIDEVRADFHLCMENSSMPNYISEKIHHGFQSDRVVLYLGCSRIHEFVPDGAFVNLNKFFDPGTRTVRASDVAQLILGMSQDEYDRTLDTARRWRRSDMLEDRLEAERARVTMEVLRFL